MTLLKIEQTQKSSEKRSFDAVSELHVVLELSHKVENPPLCSVSSSEETLIKERLCWQPAAHELDNKQQARIKGCVGER